MPAPGGPPSRPAEPVPPVAPPPPPWEGPSGTDRDPRPGWKSPGPRRTAHRNGHSSWAPPPLPCSRPNPRCAGPVADPPPALPRTGRHGDQRAAGHALLRIQRLHDQPLAVGEQFGVDRKAVEPALTAAFGQREAKAAHVEEAVRSHGPLVAVDLLAGQHQVANLEPALQIGTGAAEAKHRFRAQAVQEQRRGCRGIGLADPAVLQRHALPDQRSLIERLPAAAPHLARGELPAQQFGFQGDSGDQGNHREAETRGVKREMRNAKRETRKAITMLSCISLLVSRFLLKACTSHV